MRNQKGMALVTLLAFLALAMLLFAGMITAFQTSVARDKGEFEDQQVLMMAESHMELAKNQLMNKDTIKEVLASGRSTEQEFLSSKYQDIESKVNYKLDSENCIEIGNVETCTYPLTLTSTSTMRGATRTLKAKTEIIKTTTMSSVPEDIIQAMDNTLIIGEITGDHGEILSDDGTKITNKDEKKIYVDITGKVVEGSVTEQYNVSYKDDDYKDLELCSFGLPSITSSCSIQTNVTEKTVTVKPGESEIIQLVVAKDVTFESVKIINAGADNSAVVITILDGKKLTFNSSQFTYNSEAGNRQNMIIAKGEEEDISLVLVSLVATNELKINGLIYTPNSLIDLGNGNDYSKAVEGVVLTKSFVYPRSMNNALKLTHANINLGMFCSNGSFCPFVEKPDDGEEGEGEGGDTDADGTTVINYSLGEFKYAK